MLYEILWQQNTHLAEACLHHPFVRGLADGTLYPEAFRRYVAQDAFFLNAFAPLSVQSSSAKGAIEACMVLPACNAARALLPRIGGARQAYAGQAARST